MKLARVLPLSLLLTNCAAQESERAAPVVAAPAAPAPQGAAPQSAAATEVPSPPSIPEAIAVPSTQRVVFKATGKGVQIYTCKEKEGASPQVYEWALKAPDADLFDDNGQKIGKHYAGPTWESTDGSKVVGKLRAKTDAPDANAIPWLLLDAKSTEGVGALSKVKTIQRVATVGGKAPSGGCDAAHANAETRSEYTAMYRMYGP